MESLHSVPEPSAVDRLIARSTSFGAHSTAKHELYALALQIKQNLEHQHDWQGVTVHTHSPLGGDRELARPVLSGLPPGRVYIHPDEQMELIKAGIRDEQLKRQAEWVLPSHIREKWTLGQFAATFNILSAVPPTAPEQDVDRDARWRQKKRLLLATVEDDSTVVYYVVHDGIVKPRQN